MESYLNKKYKLVSNDKFDEFLTEIGVNTMKRTIAVNSHPVVQLSRNGDIWTLSTKSVLKSIDLKFKLGEEFQEERADGVKVKSVITIEGNKITHVMKGPPEVTVIREYNGDEMVAVGTVNNVISKRIYKAQ